MATATQTAPTEAEIREAIAGRVREALGDLSEILYVPLRVIHDSDMARTREPSGWVKDFYPPDDHPGTLWADLTSQESEEIRTVDEAIDLDAIAEMIVENLVTATVAFGRRHPDAPRGRYVPGADQ